ncbi:MAG: UPF0280 family protein [Candidatus Eremiobacteraeota bacterium]|nr:UPF0280 family protein [Candidatus Eremiobacteraeota bacterium]
MERFYRKQIRTYGKFSFEVKIEQSDLFVVCDKNLCEQAHDALREVRNDIENYITRDNLFAKTLEPHHVPNDVPAIIKEMSSASEKYNVGPMASVAGAVSQYLGRKLDPLCNYIVIENGGDIYFKSDRPITLGIWAGERSPFSGRLKFKLDSPGKSLGICTSSGTVGHSLSFGKADAVVAVADCASLADAAATSIANTVKSSNDIEPALEREKERGLLEGLIIVIGDRVGVQGNLELV